MRMAAPRTKASRKRSSELTLEDWATRLLIVSAALNINGVFVMAFGIGRVTSLVMLATSLFLVFRIGRPALTGATPLFLLAIGSYVGLGAMYTDGEVETSRMFGFIQTYVGTLLIVWAIAASYVSAANSQKLDKLVGFVRNAFLVTAIAVWASPLLYLVYINPPPSMGSRMAGFFANPNEAGAASAAALALVLAIPYRSKAMTLIAVIIAFGAIVLTFSKTAIALGLAIIGVFVFLTVRGPLLLITPLLSLVVLIIVQEPRQVTNFVLDQQFIELTSEQQRRVTQIGDLLSGEIDEDVTTGRTELWTIGIERALESFPAGSGLGSFHNLEGGVLSNNGHWLGVHNAYIMFWGEGGLLPGALFLTLMIFIPVMLSSRSSSTVLWLLFLVMAVASTSTHGIMGHRYMNVVYGVVLGAISLAQRKKAPSALNGRRFNSPPSHRKKRHAHS